jgi:exonuclease SbcC
MLIKKLSLSNFKQYKEETIENFPIGLTGLVGKNGSGKSTLFEAIYYALFGKSLEGKVVYLRNDHSEGAPLSVTLEFEEKENRYRVVRKVKGKNNTVEARLEILKDEIDPPHFKEIAVDATPVSREIYKILRIDAESFKNSFFAKQKETAGIINGTQTQRLEAFRKMLGFDKYDDLIDKIDKMIETTKNAAVTLSGFLLGAEVVIEYKEQIETLGADLKAKAETVAALKLDLNGKQVIKTERASVVNSLDKKRILHTKLGTSITATETSIKNTEDLLVSYEKKINELETLAAEIAVERHVIDEYDQINKLIENLNTSKNLKTRYDAIVENRQRTIIARDEVNSKIVASIEEMEGLPDYEAKITVEENLLSEKRLHLETLNERASDLRTNLNTVNNELKKCQSRLINVQKLDSEGVCPECERPLGEHKPQLVSKYNDEIAISIEKQNALNESLTTLGSQITEKKSEISVVESRIAELKELVVERERKIDLISQLKERVATLEATIGQANSDITALGEITFDQQQLDTALSSQEDIKSRYDKYNTKLGRVASLEATKQEKLDQMSILKNFGTILESLKKEQQDVGFSEEEFAKVKTALEDISTVIEKVTETIHSEEKDLSEQKSKIENYTRELEKDSTHREQYSRMERDVTLFKIYKDVVNDYKAKMTKRAIPQVATNADKLFTELTGGRYMGLEMTDDLAVTVSRDGQSAPLSTLSGGEKDLAAICLRVAISQEIVSNASGGKIGFLAFDEVFGAQDEDRRDLLVQALQRLPEHFKQVFVVSHNGDVEAELPNRIVIVKRGHFSVIDRIVRNN